MSRRLRFDAWLVAQIHVAGLGCLFPLHLNLVPRTYPWLDSAQSFSFVITSSARNPQNEIDNDSSQQRYSQNRRTEAVVKATLTPHPNALRAPVICHERIDHRSHGDECEEASRDLANLVAKVQKANGQSAKDNGEVEP